MRVEDLLDFDRRDVLCAGDDELVATPLKKFVGLGLLSDDGEQLQLTREGLFVSDALWPEFL